MAKLLFKNENLQSVITYTEQANTFGLTYAQQIAAWEAKFKKEFDFSKDEIPEDCQTTDKPQLFFVKDSGIYLMTAAVMEKMPEDMSHVAYAKGYSPSEPNCWEKCTAAVGGDDFGEAIELSKEAMELIKGGSDIVINVTAKTFSIKFLSKAKVN